MSDDLLITAELELLVIGDLATETVVLIEQELLVDTVLEVIETSTAELLVEQSSTYDVLDVTEAAELLEIGLQGPPGPQGPEGSINSVPYVTFLASTPLSGNRAVRLDAGLARYASSTVPTDANLVLGITRGAASAGAPVQIQTSGLMTEPSWAWTADKPVFCGANGALTQTMPVAGFGLILGVALSAIQIYIGARMPIALT